MNQVSHTIDVGRLSFNEFFRLCQLVGKSCTLSKKEMIKLKNEYIIIIQEVGRSRASLPRGLGTLAREGSTGWEGFRGATLQCHAPE